MKVYARLLASGALASLALPMVSAGAQEMAVAKMQTQDGRDAGTVMMRETANGVHFMVEVQNLPSGVHAFHVHQKGECQPPDFKSAGDHYAPAGKEHGFHAEGGPHAGDLPNIHIPESGTARVEYFNPNLSLRKDAKNTLFDEDGSAVVVHAKPDDYKSQPSGDAGDRLACGVVQSATQSAGRQ